MTNVLRSWLLYPALLTCLAVAQARAQPEEAPVETAAPRVVGVDLHGSIDPPGRVEAYIATIAPANSFYVESGDIDRIAAPVSTIGRLRRGLERIGYDAVIEPVPAGAGAVRLRVHLRALDRVRHIFVRGNGLRVREEQVLRRLSLRPGQALPLAGPARDELLESERKRVEDYLRGRGYLDAQVRIEVRATNSVPARVNLRLNVSLGEGYTVDAVKVKGNTAMSSKEIADALSNHALFRVWQWPFEQTAFRNELTELTDRYRKLGYPGVRITHDFDPVKSIDRVNKKVRFSVEVRERKRIEVAFEGNKRRSDDALEDVITIFSRGSYDDYEVESSAQAIAQHYRDRGHLLVKVKWRRERLSDNADRLVFTVDEGPELRVREVRFDGAREIPTATLNEWVTVKTFPPLGSIGIGEGGYATIRQLQLDVERLVDRYAAEGFPDAKVACEIAPAGGAFRPVRPLRPEDEAEWRTARSLHVRFIVEEGVRVRVGSIRFEREGDGDPLPRSELFLRDSMLTATGTPYRPALLRQDVERLQRVFGDEGYPQASADPNVERQGDRADILFKIKLGPRVRVGPLFVRGNFVTREHAITRWMPLTPGGPLTTTGVERSQRNLALIQLFDNPNPLQFPSDTNTTEVAPVLVEVEERHDHWGVVRVGGGASTEQRNTASSLPWYLQPLYAAAGYEHRNLFGLGWTLTSQAAYGNSVTRADAAFLDPRFFDTLFRLELTASYLRRSTVRLGDIRSGGGTIGFLREMYPGVDAGLRYAIRNTTRTEFLLRGAGPDEEQRTVQIGTFVGSLALSLDWQRLDNPLAPTRGFKISAGVEYAHPGLSFDRGQDRFVKLTGRSLVVSPLLRWLSLRHSVRYDQGFPLGGASLLPKVERFPAGGDTTLRGFEFDRARVEVIRAPIAPGVNSIRYQPIGGSLRILHNVDLQFPILGAWHGSVFVDSGIVADSLDDLHPEDFRHGAGISPLLLKLPIGDISVAWAWPLDPGPGDRRIGQLHLNVGLMF